ncbi:ABC transporter ATP-binding protein [Acholeplasma laidlawii]|uniref:ABC-type transport system, ATPase component n=1 Tax=Acholeplasma laidlawii (strain PG-8A) TaxID=441768 RepID=A9NGB0_ACHLI|nr:ABC transporter ATP-binding protein [Acholeplasma laidlawii]ABX81390.1 ABC-type transport system, ATPase component [Acholeplasma laidlawii PG-8A]OAN19089.1 ATP-binding protein [Acholeplasma laidlawii]OED27765.1 ATP-binding protein [Acholeplasma laidlawii]OED28446.1 ATP-binding protein [Acholeplasma laidlawii]OWU87866.1 ATP-binding protein [Acholeplasma laidlawii]
MFSVRDLRFTYPKNHVETIKGISFEIKKGEIFGFLGPSGAGKSTTQKILIKLLDRYQGSIYYDSKSLSELNESFYEDIGVSFEMPIHFSKLTAMENIEFFLKLYKNHADIEDLMKSVGLWEDRNKMVGEFSKGMKIRLNFVRAMLNNPKMLFLDEPTNGLDPANAMILKNLIKAYQKQGGTVFVTSHIMADIDQLCDRVAFIVDGQIKEIDSPRNLKIKYGKRTIKVEYNENNHTASQIFDMDGLNENGTFFKLLKEKKIETIHTGETTLEEIFIKVTGVGLNHA